MGQVNTSRSHINRETETEREREREREREVIEAKAEYLKLS